MKKEKTLIGMQIVIDPDPVLSCHLSSSQTIVPLFQFT